MAVQKRYTNAKKGKIKKWKNRVPEEMKGGREKGFKVPC